jgi:hypothetical protein
VAFLTLLQVSDSRSQQLLQEAQKSAKSSKQRVQVQAHPRILFAFIVILIATGAGTNSH